MKEQGPGNEVPAPLRALREYGAEQRKVVVEASAADDLNFAAHLRLVPLSTPQQRSVITVEGPDGDPVRIRYCAGHRITALQPPDLHGLKLSQLEREIFETKAYQRLRYVFQMGLRYSARGESFDHTRDMHCRAAMATAGRVAKQLGFDATATQIVRVAALLHDIGHPPFGHSGEIALAQIDPTFDHDDLGVRIVNRGQIARTLRRHGIDPTLIGRVLDDHETGDKQINLYRAVVKEVADRCAYLRMDSLGVGFSPDVVEAIFRATYDFERSLFVKDQMLCTSSESAAIRVLACRAVIYQEASCHVVSETVNQIVAQEMQSVLSRGEIGRARLSASTDFDLLKLFSRKARSWLGRGVDRSYSVPISWRVADLTDDGRAYTRSKQFASEMVQIASKVGIATRGVVASRTRDYSKELTITTAQGDRLEERVLRYSIPESKQFAFVAIPLRLEDPRVQRMAQAVQEHFLSRGYLHHRAVQLGGKVLGNVDDRLYRAAA